MDEKLAQNMTEPIRLDYGTAEGRSSGVWAFLGGGLMGAAGIFFLGATLVMLLPVPLVLLIVLVLQVALLVGVLVEFGRHGESNLPFARGVTWGMILGMVIEGAGVYGLRLWA